MTPHLQLPQLPPKFQSHPECSIGVMTLEDAQFLLDQGWLTLDGAQCIFPEHCWDLLFRAYQASRAVKEATEKGKDRKDKSVVQRNPISRPAAPAQYLVLKDGARQSRN